MFTTFKADFMFFESSKTKGGTLWRKHIIFKKILIWTRVGLKLQIIFSKIKKKTATSERAQGCNGENTMLYIFLLWKFYLRYFKNICFFPLIFELLKNRNSAQVFFYKKKVMHQLIKKCFLHVVDNSIPTLSIYHPPYLCYDSGEVDNY